MLLALAALGGASLLSPARVAAKEEVEAWLDRAVATKAEPGSQLSVGFVLWDAVGRSLAGGTFPYVRVTPASGDGAPTEAVANETWPGHFVAVVDVPEGGVGQVTIEVRGTACDADGCRDANALVPIAGTGLPSGVPLPAVAAVQINVPKQVVAGQPAPFEIRLEPNAGLDPAAVPVPDRLFLQAVDARGVALGQVPAAQTADGSLVYRATETFPDAARYAIVASASAAADTTADTAPADDQVFAASSETVTVEPAILSAPVSLAPVAPGAPNVPSTADTGLLPANLAPLAIGLGAVGLLAVTLVAILALGGARSGRRRVES
jgi:hypothetical protein